MCVCFFAVPRRLQEEESSSQGESLQLNSGPTTPTLTSTAVKRRQSPRTVGKRQKGGPGPGPGPGPELICRWGQGKPWCFCSSHCSTFWSLGTSGAFAMSFPHPVLFSLFTLCFLLTPVISSFLIVSSSQAPRGWKCRVHHVSRFDVILLALAWASRWPGEVSSHAAFSP